jgi:hypothetical protein
LVHFPACGKGAELMWRGRYKHLTRP